MLNANNYYKSKAAIKKQVAAFKQLQQGLIDVTEAKIQGVRQSDIDKGGVTLRYEETSMHGTEYKDTGTVLMVGPDAYTKRVWYASITLVNGFITQVK